MDASLDCNHLILRQNAHLELTTVLQTTLAEIFLHMMIRRSCVKKNTSKHLERVEKYIKHTKKDSEPFVKEVPGGSQLIHQDQKKNVCCALNAFDGASTEDMRKCLGRKFELQ